MFRHRLISHCLPSKAFTGRLPGRNRDYMSRKPQTGFIHTAEVELKIYTKPLLKAIVEKWGAAQENEKMSLVA